MIDLRKLKPYRWFLYGFDNSRDDQGAFAVASKIDGGQLRCIASSCLGWDHVSVSRVDRIPNWIEMEQVRRLFFRPEEFAFQYHAPIADYVDGTYKGNCETCLHLWRPHDATGFPMPPKWMVGGMLEEEAQALYEAAEKRFNATGERA